MHAYRTLLGYARRQRGRFIVIALLTVCASSLVALQPWPMKLLVDHVLGAQPVGEWLQNVFATPRALLAGIVMGGLALFVINAALDAGLTWLWTVAGRRMVYDLAEDMLNREASRSKFLSITEPRSVQKQIPININNLEIP